MNKNIIKNKLENMEIEEAQKLIEEYELVNKKDLEIYSLKINVLLLKGQVEEALELAQKAVRINPLNVETNYNLALAYEMNRDYLNAIIFYAKSVALEDNDTREALKDCDLSNKMVELYNLIEDEKIKKYITENLQTAFGYKINVFHNLKEILSRDYIDPYFEEYYLAKHFKISDLLKSSNNTVFSKAEVRKTIFEGKKYYLNKEKENYIIPILSKETKNHIKITTEETKSEININNGEHFNYYKMKGDSIIEAEDQILIGKPIKLDKDKNKKSLVLNIFLDGLSELVLNEECFENIMPKTYKYFSKGIICKNAHSISEWTYPSIATYVTGYNSINHMMIHNNIHTELPKDVTILPEYFNANGYNTTMVNGNWRISPNYGYMRGIDKHIYQHQYVGFPVNEVVNETIEQIELLKDTNHYIWCSIGDLHIVADEYDLNPSVQSKLEISELSVESGTTSAKQPYSKNKRLQYIKQAKMVDRNLGVLFDYIKENFVDEEIIVSLFSDHGQAYLIKPDGFFMGKERTNVGFMFRGSNIKPEINEELISTEDYKSIMCSLCNIEMKKEKIDGKLPKAFLGEKEREYVYSESIHPKDCYYACIRYKDYFVHFESVDYIKEDCRFDINKGFKLNICTNEGKEFLDEDKYKKNMDIIIKHVEPILIYN